MRTWLQSIKKEHVVTMMLTMGIVGIATAAQAAGGGGIPAWAPMGNMMDSVQGVPAFACWNGADGRRRGDHGHGRNRHRSQAHRFGGGRNRSHDQCRRDDERLGDCRSTVMSAPRQLAIHPSLTAPELTAHAERHLIWPFGTAVVCVLYAGFLQSSGMGGGARCRGTRLLGVSHDRSD